jgi:GntR family transcriptional regulator, transcriptional repressor for pyruvate dehydrogenase complex
MVETFAPGGPATVSSHDDPVFTPVRTKRGYEYIVEQIREAITSGRFRPGDRLPAERVMAETFGVSRQGVREAVRGLESTGLVEIRLGVQGGAYVRSGDPGTVTRAMTDLASLGALSPQSLLEARIVLTSSVIRLACERATAEDLERIEVDIAAIEQQAARPGFERHAAITDFYRLLAEATHNEVLVMLTDSLAQIVHARLNRAGPPPDHDIGVLRRRVLDLVRAGDADAAIAEVTGHLTRLEERLRTAERAAERAAAAPQ